MRLVGVVALLLAWSSIARAQTYPPIQDRDFAIDLYSGAALGSVRIVGMGGTALATAEGSAGTLANPAAAAVRLTTSKGSWDWDFHLDALNAAYASDFDNNGVRGTDDFGTRIETAGIAGMLYGWGLAITATTASTSFEGAVTGERLAARELATKISLAKELFAQQWTVGGAIKVATFALDAVGGPQLFSLSGTGLEVGGLWRPPRKDYRVGAALTLPLRGNNVTVEGCDPMDCDGYILPDRLAAPWQIAAGVAWRRAPTWWNQQVSTHYRDERTLLMAADVVVSGAVADGAGLEKFGAQELQPSGRHTVVSVRAGAEYEALPARLRLRLGSYWEPSRFEGVGGRLHGTAGVEVSLFELHVWHWMFRTRVSVTADLAPRYGNAGVSVGFWH